MKKIDLLEILLWIIVIMSIIAYITLFGAIIYLIWFMITGHIVFKALITLFIIALLIISISSCIYGYKKEEMNKVD